jgi:membrane glycosyltransferase
MQYWRLVTLPNLTPVSRYQLVLAILMFVGSPAWVGLLGLATAALALCDDPADIMRSDIGSVLLIWVLVMWFSPKIAGALDVLLAREERRAFGGSGRFIVNFAIETGYSIILCPILWISHTIFLFGRLFNRDIDWMGQVRDDHVVPFGLALRDLWPQTLVGCLSLGFVLTSQPWALPYILLLAGGPAFAAPFATVTAWPILGSVAARIGIGRLPEETATPDDLLELALPAITAESRPPLTSSV